MSVDTKKQKITLLAENLFVMKSVRTYKGEPDSTLYYMTPAMWARSPMSATIFTDYDAATAHMVMLRTRDLKNVKNADGESETLDIVPLYGELIKITK